MSLERGNLGKFGVYAAGKSAETLRNEARFLSTFPTGNHAQGLRKTGFLFKLQEERITARMPMALWNFQSHRDQKGQNYAETALTLPFRSMLAPILFSII